MTPTFNTADTATWPVVLTIQHMAEIYSRSIGGIRKACMLGRFLPAPYQKRPYRWRRVDVLRDVETGRGVPLRRVG